MWTVRLKIASHDNHTSSTQSAPSLLIGLHSKKQIKNKKNKKKEAKSKELWGGGERVYASSISPYPSSGSSSKTPHTLLLSVTSSPPWQILKLLRFSTTTITSPSSASEPHRLLLLPSPLRISKSLCSFSLRRFPRSNAITR